MVKAYLGIKPKGQSSAPTQSEGDLGEAAGKLMSALPQTRNAQAIPADVLAARLDKIQRK